jgi:3-oxoacyl-[acyl-carrier protein] reductase
MIAMLKNKVVIITGSTRGIGKSVAKKMAIEGAAVVVNGRHKETVDETVKEIETEGGKAIGVAGAVEQMKTGERLVNEALRHFGKVDILINNAGIVRDRMSYNMTEQEWDDVIAVHLKGTFSCTKAFVNELKKSGHGGVIINMTSTAGLEGTIGQLNYSAAKAGIIGMTWTLAKELKKFGIRVNAVAPAALTDMTRPLVERAIQDAEKQGKELDSYWKIGTADEAASFIVNLAAIQEMKLTGEIFSVNGTTIGRWSPPTFQLIVNENGSTNDFFPF